MNNNKDIKMEELNHWKLNSDRFIELKTFLDETVELHGIDQSDTVLGVMPDGDIFYKIIPKKEVNIVRNSIRRNPMS